MKTLRSASILCLAPLLLSVQAALAQAPAAASSARPVPDLSTHRMPPHDARILYSQGRVQVIADDSSLNLTLLQIAAAAGIRVSGVAAEERIFGSYGPSTPAALFRALLQGTGTNMLLTQNSANGTAELVLTQQNGPVTPPSVHPTMTDRQTSPVASAVPVQTGPGANTSPADHGSGQAEPDGNTAEPAPAPIPLTSGERALLVDRLQQQQRQVARPH